MKWRFLFLLIGFLSPVFGEEFKPRQVVPAFDAITKPETALASEADKWIKDDELVLGVTIDDQSRAYSINMLTNPTREIINDSLGGRSIAATW